MKISKEPKEMLYESMMEYCVRVLRTAIDTNEWDALLAQQLCALPHIAKIVIENKEKYQRGHVSTLYRVITEFCIHAMSGNAHPQIIVAMEQLLPIILSWEKKN